MPKVRSVVAELVVQSPPKDVMKAASPPVRVTRPARAAAKTAVRSRVMAVSFVRGPVCRGFPSRAKTRIGPVCATGAR